MASMGPTTIHASSFLQKKKGPAKPYGIEPLTAFYVFLAANFLAAAFSPIQDCDETFNYWEPTHYLSHGYGLQTWEYSPEYAIRSWLYIGLHAVVGSLRRLLPRPSKVAEFYFVRYALASACAMCQTFLWRAVCRALNPRIGLFFIMALAVSPGNFHASAAYLPSSFAMYAAMLGAAAFMDWRGGLKTSWGIFWFAVAGIVGWPFAMALCAPFLLEEAFFAIISDKDMLFQAFIRVARGVTGALIVVALDLAVNTFFYRKMEIASWNIIKYNIFSSAGGPELYGTEPWTFYFKNLALNFNIWFLLALLSLPLFLTQKLVSMFQAASSAPGSAPATFQSGMRTLVFLTPFYLWLAIFTLQPHKEERFMYPAYPFLAINAALSVHILLAAWGHVRLIPAKLRLAAVAGSFVLAWSLSILRTYGVYTGYGAPLAAYKPLDAAGRPGDSVCFGKEWYRFPSSYFLPNDMHAKWVRSEFRGLLPGEFAEARVGFGLRGGTWLVPSGMNDRNEEDAAKYVDDVHTACTFLVDTQYPEQQQQQKAAAGWARPPREPDYVADADNWEPVGCMPFLDAASTSFVARALWVPDWNVIPARLRRKWGRHCLLKRKA